MLRVKGENEAICFASLRDELKESVEFGVRIGDDIGESYSFVERVAR